MTKGISDGTDYDSPRNKDEDEESLQALGKSSQNTSNDMDDDENAIAEITSCRARISATRTLR